MRLDELVAALPEVLGADVSPARLTDVEHDSRAVGEGALFACISGSEHDGHAHAPAAVAAGAVALLVERRLDLPVPQILVADVRRALGPAAAAVYGDPSSAIPVMRKRRRSGMWVRSPLARRSRLAATAPTGRSADVCSAIA